MKIYLYCEPAPEWGEGRVRGRALTEDGVFLASHISSQERFSELDLQSEKFLLKYHEAAMRGGAKERPELEWVPSARQSVHHGLKDATLKALRKGELL